MKQVKITFNEELHKYTDEEGSVYTSVTQLIGKVTPEYPAKFWAMYRALDQTGYKLAPDIPNDTIIVGGVRYTITELYAGIVRTLKTPAEIKADWKAITDRSLARGNKTHNYLEDCVNAFYKKGNNEFQLSDINETSFRFKIVSEEQLHNSPLQYSHKLVYDTLVKMIASGYTIYAEKRVYSYEHKVSGTIDILAVRGKEFWILDWKTNKDELKFLPGYYKKAWNSDRSDKVKTDKWVATDERFEYPLHNLHLSKGMGYVLQLSLYAYLCEMWGLQCKGLILFHLREDDEKVYPPRPYTLEYKKHEVGLLLEWQLAKLRIRESYK